MRGVFAEKARAKYRTRARGRAAPPKFGAFFWERKRRLFGLDPAWNGKKPRQRQSGKGAIFAAEDASVIYIAAGAAATIVRLGKR